MNLPVPYKKSGQTESRPSYPYGVNPKVSVRYCCGHSVAPDWAVLAQSWHQTDLRLPQRFKGYIYSSGMLRSLYWCLVTDISRQLSVQSSSVKEL